MISKLFFSIDKVCKVCPTSIDVWLEIPADSRAIISGPRICISKSAAQLYSTVMCNSRAFVILDRFIGIAVRYNYAFELDDDDDEVSKVAAATTTVILIVRH
ncbi:unnamed protein product [Ceratitis capitata]|uniref:(Mediterranean fruit fly) hypothetical protein n=1 Tax=Ceratitis capitata TaxID=7213 RepID=A0A811UMX9_CERCA|nr:unnamed protein product [Ceratitis capitata]